MATSKKASQKAKSTSPSKSAKGGGSAKAATRSGPVPPYGVAIKEALARGDVQDMRTVAASGRKHLKEIQTLLTKLENAVSKKSGK